jgi:hypothetical protein
MSALFDTQPTMADLIGRLAFAVDDIKIASESLRRVGDSLLNRANALQLFIRVALHQHIAERPEREAVRTTAKVDLDPLGDSERTEAPRALLAFGSKTLGTHAEECSGAWTVPIVVMANLRRAQA